MRFTGLVLWVRQLGLSSRWLWTRTNFSTLDPRKHRLLHKRSNRHRGLGTCVLNVLREQIPWNGSEDANVSTASHIVAVKKPGISKPSNHSTIGSLAQCLPLHCSPDATFSWSFPRMRGRTFQDHLQHAFCFGMSAEKASKCTDATTAMSVAVCLHFWQSITDRGDHLVMYRGRGDRKMSGFAFDFPLSRCANFANAGLGGAFPSLKNSVLGSWGSLIPLGYSLAVF